ncbi:PID-CTERM protein-sorting domain-containing protein [Chitinophagaceae bacterium LWZ2-11]
MKQIQKIFNIQTLFVLVVLLMPALVHAQDSTPGDPDAAPIDGGLSLLVAGGVAYGAKKIRDNRKAKEEAKEK